VQYITTDTVGDYAKAYKKMKEAVTLDPSKMHDVSTFLFIKRHVCDWSDYDNDLETINRIAIAEGKTINKRYREVRLAANN
jgi:hypothetical protein